MQATPFAPFEPFPSPPMRIDRGGRREAGSAKVKRPMDAMLDQGDVAIDTVVP